MGRKNLDTDKYIVRFKDLAFKPHPNASFIFTNQAIVVTPEGGRISVVGPRKNIWGDVDNDVVGKYEILYSGWDGPIGYITEEEVDLLLVKIQKNPLDLLPEIGKHRFIK